MDRDDQTLPEAVRTVLLRARHVVSSDSRNVVTSSLRAADEHARVLALRAGAHHRWLSSDDWDHASRDESGSVRREVASLLAAHDNTFEGRSEILLRLLSDEDALVVDAAAFALGEVEVIDAVPALISVANDHEDARCRESAIAALGSIGDPRAEATVIAALTDKPPVRRRAVVALTNFDSEAVEEALEAARDDRDWQVRSAIDQLDRDDD